MHAKIRAQWCAALRSAGKYARGGAHMRSIDDTWCPLGILSDLYLAAIGRNLWIKNADKTAYTLHGSEYVLPPQVRDWAGFTLDECPGLSPVTKAGRALWCHFQTDNASFDEVARLVEENF